MFLAKGAVNAGYYNFRSYGSAGSLLGRKLAERLGYQYVDERSISRMKTNKEAASVLMMNLEDERSPGFMITNQEPCITEVISELPLVLPFS